MVRYQGNTTGVKAEAEAQIFWPHDVKSHTLEKTLMLGKVEGRRRREWQRMRLLDSITDSTDMNLSKLGELVKDGGTTCLQSMGCKESDTT